jgi:hypothetical protein
MRKQTQTTISKLKIFWKQASVNALEGAIFGAFLGPVISVILAFVVWCVKAGLFVGFPASRDIVFSFGMGLLEGALAGALLALLECAKHPNRFLNPLPLENLDR